MIKTNGDADREATESETNGRRQSKIDESINNEVMLPAESMACLKFSYILIEKADLISVVVALFFQYDQFGS